MFERCWKMLKGSPKVLNGLCKVYGRCWQSLKDIWKVFGRSQNGVWAICKDFEKCVQGFGNVFGSCLEGSARCLKDVSNFVNSLTGVARHLKYV